MVNVKTCQTFFARYSLGRSGTAIDALSLHQWHKKLSQVTLQYALMNAPMQNYQSNPEQFVLTSSAVSVFSHPAACWEGEVKLIR